jgi:hypothetical protein
VLIGRTTTLCYNGGLLTPYNSVLSEKLLIAQLIEKLDASRSSRKLIVVFTELVNGPVENQMMPAYCTCVYLTSVLPFLLASHIESSLYLPGLTLYTNSHFLHEAAPIQSHPCWFYGHNII